MSDSDWRSDIDSDNGHVNPGQGTQGLGRIRTEREMSQRHTARKKRSEKKALVSDNEWATDHDSEGYVTPDEDTESVGRAANAARMRQKRLQRTPKSAALDRAGNAGQKKHARAQLTPKSAALERAGNAGRKMKARASVVSQLADKFESSVNVSLEQSQWLNNQVFSDADLARLEADFDHEPNAAIAWMAATSTASFGYRSCSMDEQLEAILGELRKSSSVAPPRALQTACWS